MADGGDELRVPSPNPDWENTAEGAARVVQPPDFGGTTVASTAVVANTSVDAQAPPVNSPERDMVNDGPDGERDLAAEVATSRVRFIRKFALGKGVSAAVLAKRWRDKKNGYPKHYDRSFDKFRLWWLRTQRGAEFSPTNILPGLITEYLTVLSEGGMHHDSLRDVSSSISMACLEGSDGDFQPGMCYSVITFMEGERRQRPMRRKNKGVYADVALLYQEAWLYGPDEALSLGHQKEKIILLMMADTAARPSDLSRLFRVYEGWCQQIVFTPAGVKVRFYYPKEVDPGSSRNNATGYYFSTWVEIKKTVPAEISTPECLRRFLDASSGDEFAYAEVPLLDSSAQSFAWGKRMNGKLQPSSVDHIANVTKDGLKAAGMNTMTARSLRGASPSKIVQLFPDLLPQALGLGRWTNPKTFRNHYQGPVDLVSATPPPDSMKSNVQQVLRWGFEPKPPEGISAVDYMKGPTFWVGQTVRGLGKIYCFVDSVYEVRFRAVKTEFFHYELMDAVSMARQSSGVIDC